MEVLNRVVHTDKYNDLMERLNTEHDLFYYMTLAKTPKEVYEDFGRIRFYECVYEYFRYKENIKADYISACLREEYIFSSLYELYLKYEHLNVGSWEQVEELLNALAYR